MGPRLLHGVSCTPQSSKWHRSCPHGPRPDPTWNKGLAPGCQWCEASLSCLGPLDTRVSSWLWAWQYQAGMWRHDASTPDQHDYLVSLMSMSMKCIYSLWNLYPHMLLGWPQLLTSPLPSSLSLHHCLSHHHWIRYPPDSQHNSTLIPSTPPAWSAALQFFYPSRSSSLCDLQWFVLWHLVPVIAKCFQW